MVRGLPVGGLSGRRGAGRAAVRVRRGGAAGPVLVRPHGDRRYLT
ncbi:hypothetical protein ACWCZ5_05590 [Streptomyces sp. NPDC001667]